MLKRTHRLTKKDNFESILKNGGKSLGRLLVFRMRENQKDSHRFGVVISQKVGARAVDRNRIKRQINEIVRLNYDKLPQKSHFDILILPKKAIMEATHQEIKDDLLYLISRFNEK